MAKKRKPGGGRKPSKPDYNPSAILQNQMDAAVALYDKEEHPSIQTIANELDLNPIKVRKLLITAGVYKSEVADQLNRVFNKHRASGLSHTEAITATMRELNLSKSSVTSYLPYEKGVYFPAEIDNKNLSVGAERIRRMRKRNKVLETLLNEQSEDALWAAVIVFQGYKFRTYSGLVFSYSLKKGRGDTYTKELFIDRRENSKSLAWSSVLLAFHNIPSIGSVIDRPRRYPGCDLHLRNVLSVWPDRRARESEREDGAGEESRFRANEFCVMSRLFVVPHNQILAMCRILW